MRFFKRPKDPIVEEFKRIRDYNARIIAAIDASRVAAGVCRHCAGPVPCYSLDFGDVRVGVRHPRKERSC